MVKDDSQRDHSEIKPPLSIGGEGADSNPDVHLGLHNDISTAITAGIAGVGADSNTGEDGKCRLLDSYSDTDRPQHYSSSPPLVRNSSLPVSTSSILGKGLDSASSVVSKPHNSSSSPLPFEIQPPKMVARNENKGHFTQEDLNLILNQKAMLNDNVINTYIETTIRPVFPETPTVVWHNTFKMSSIRRNSKRGGEGSTKPLASKEESHANTMKMVIGATSPATARRTIPLDYQVLDDDSQDRYHVYPVHKSKHWFLLIVYRDYDTSSAEIAVWDPWVTRKMAYHQNDLRILAQYTASCMLEVHNTKHGALQNVQQRPGQPQEADGSEITVNCILAENCLIQPEANTSDCGVYLVRHVGYFAQDPDAFWEHRHMREPHSSSFDVADERNSMASQLQYHLGIRNIYARLVTLHRDLCGADQELAQLKRHCAHAKVAEEEREPTSQLPGLKAIQRNRANGSHSSGTTSASASGVGPGREQERGGMQSLLIQTQLRKRRRKALDTAEMQSIKKRAIGMKLDEAIMLTTTMLEDDE